MSGITHKIDHIWHVWINQRCPIGQESDPPMRTLYAFKGAMQFLGWAGKQIKAAREGALRTTHQHCSHCLPEQISDNQLMCYLGQNVATCPILNDLQACFDEERKRTYYADVTNEDVYEAMAHVCTWHLLMSDIATKADALPPGRFVDWNEGAFQDKSDRMFWERVYESMSQPDNGDNAGEKGEAPDERL